MPLQNRVTPFGDIVAIAQRGLFMGNRGIIHDPRTRTLTKRRWNSKAWITCVCEFRGVRRAVMSRRSWTELFFLDEATALAAGHRPCFYCRREAARAFAAAWARAHDGNPVTAAAIDAALHAQRLQGRGKRIHPLREALTDFPDGTMVVLSGDAYLLARGRAFRWTESGYAAPCALRAADGLLTPPSTVATLRAGYACVLHPQVSDVRDRRPASDCL
ncbi:MAG TPA: hypothetical protein VFP37_00950 [Steroidobacteraceae bacterium]|nr:hypothetical protein [Steroidobacteraceae bacterium]